MSKKKTPVRDGGKIPTKSASTINAAIEKVSEVQTDPPKKDLLRKRELIERVALRAGAKKKDVKPIVEVLLAEMGETLASGSPCALPPLGRIVVNRQKELPDGRVVILKLRQKTKQTSSVADKDDPPLSDD